MYGWRARVGLVLPMDNAVMEPELYALNLEGVSFYTARLTTCKREEMPEQGIRISEVFNELGVDMIVYACAETSFLKGVDGNAYISEQITKQTGVPAITATTAMVEAAGQLGVSSVSLVTPYTQERTNIMKDFLQRNGIRVDGVESRDFSVGSDKPEWYECNVQPPSAAYRMARQANRPNTQALMISATNFRTFEVINRLESDLQKPVITTNQAILWSVFRTLDLHIRSESIGKLLH